VFDALIKKRAFMTFPVDPNKLLSPVRIDPAGFGFPQEPCEPFNLARGRLANARTLFKHRGWDVLPQNERGRRILLWGADHAFMASPTNPIRSVRRWCRRWAPWLTTKQLNELAEATKTSNKRWSHDQSAAVLCVTLDDRTALKLWHLGADDDLNYDRRNAIARTKNAERSRQYRAKNRTGAKRGRPTELTPEQRLARSNAQTAERMRRYRALRKNASRPIIDIDTVTEFSVTSQMPEGPPAGGTYISSLGERQLHSEAAPSLDRQIPSDDGRETAVLRPETLSSQDRRKPAPIPSKTAFIEWNDARFREPAPNQGISEEEATLNAWCGHMDLKRGHKTPMTERMIMRKVHRDIANELGLKNNRLRFDIFKSWHMAKGIWSQDWTETWRNWCVDDVRREAEWSRKERARAYFEKLRSDENERSNYVDWRA
jgi:hypothetical protein